MIANILGDDGLIVIILAVVVLFGGSQLPKLAKNVGSAGREFRKAQREAEEAAAQTRAPWLPTLPAPVNPAPPTSAPAVDRQVINRKDLQQELSTLLDQRQERNQQ